MLGNLAARVGAASRRLSHLLGCSHQGDLAACGKSSITFVFWAAATMGVGYGDKQATASNDNEDT